MTDNSSVFGLGHQARCLTAVTHSTEQSKFLAGTVGAKDNVVCLLEYDDDNTTINSTMFAHPEEVWDIVSCPADENLLFTSHSPVSGNPSEKKATLWRKPTKESLTETNTLYDLEPVVTLEHSGIKKVLVDPKEDAQRIVSIDSSKIYFATLDSSCQTLLEIDASPVLDTDSVSLHRIQNAVWNTHQPELIVVGGRNLSGWDLRSGKNSFSRFDAHKSTIRAVDYNSNKPYHVSTGGDDALLHIWDTRSLKEPLKTIEGHSHWVWSVAFNPLQDQLLLSSSSDTLVNLHNIVSISSASYLDDSSEDELDSPSTTKPSDGLVCTYDQHEDSVYKSRH
ncbi:WD40-repeat-containing domain protein [Gilbertella persicaria]|uniref:WD40-repeat-containing domain protein n=1 Tax=Gilbertella persicaria TaxID=101096 RepID=UPI0022209D03|nr:WD40-repeat-containing domain protein [Gilbertella persicaria]KAI8097915.1 WD40-repeat-containing domain protein [Gilbertella persicaria]